MSKKSSRRELTKDKTTTASNGHTYRVHPDGGTAGGPIVDGVERCSPDNMTPRFSIYDPSNGPTETDR